jgi:hypothetical protein
MREKFRVTRKAVSAKEEGALVDGRGRNRIQAPSGAQPHGCFDITGGSFASRAGFYSRLDVTAHVVQMEDDRFLDLIGQTLVISHDVITALQVKRPGCMRQKLRVADNDGDTNAPDYLFGNCLEDDFGAYSCGVTHRDADARQPGIPAGLLGLG